MPKSKEYVYTSESSSDEDLKPKKKQKQSDDKEVKAASSKESKKESIKESNKESKSNEENVWELGNNRRVQVREFKGKMYVDVREMYMKDGDMLPSKKGISLNISQWRKLVSYIEEIDSEIKQKC